jgi:hypothetical protein
MTAKTTFVTVITEAVIFTTMTDETGDTGNEQDGTKTGPSNHRYQNGTTER